MRPPIFIRTLSEEEREALERGLRSSEAFVMRRVQILLASSRGERPPQIAANLRCAQQTVRNNAIHNFNEVGLDALRPGSSRPAELHPAFDQDGAEALQEILHKSPRSFGIEESFWTLEAAAEVSFQEGLTNRKVTAETIRATLQRMGKSWRRAKRWMESPDPEYARKKGIATG